MQETDIKAGQAVYTPFTLRLYNLIVLGICNSLAWQCATKIQLDFFNQHVSNLHLEVGVGSGYYMNHCTFPQPLQLYLMDLNRNCLHYSAQLLKRYQPILLHHDIFQPMTKIKQTFNSISLNYVLHCLPGSLPTKAIVISHLKQLLMPHGILFGSTILGQSIQPNWLARYLLSVYNKKKIFCNNQDTLTDLQTILLANFHSVKIKQIGLVALFEASHPY